MLITLRSFSQKIQLKNDLICFDKVAIDKIYKEIEISKLKDVKIIKLNDLIKLKDEELNINKIYFKTYEEKIISIQKEKNKLIKYNKLFKVGLIVLSSYIIYENVR